MKPTKQLLGTRIKELRKRKGLSQAELSEKIDIAENFLSRIEVGAKFPSLDTLEKMSAVLQADLKDFFDFEHLQEGSSDLATLERLFEDASEEERRLVLRIIRAIKK